MNSPSITPIDPNDWSAVRCAALIIACVLGCGPVWAAPTDGPRPVTAPQPSVAALDPAWESFASARRAFQIRLCELAVQRWPENRKLFTAHRNLQLAYIERRNLVFYHLKNSEPARIVRDKGGEAFLNFVWTPEEEAVFSKTIKGFSGLTSEINRLKKESSRLSRSKDLRERFLRLELDPEYLALMRETTRSIGEAERLLAGA